MRAVVVLLIALSLTSCGGGRVSGDVGRACMDAGRSAANPALCACVQRAADAQLTRGEQRRVADFFEDPEVAQAVRKSDTPSADRFWERYQAFAETARAMCGG